MRFVSGLQKSGHAGCWLRSWTMDIAGRAEARDCKREMRPRHVHPSPGQPRPVLDRRFDGRSPDSRLEVECCLPGIPVAAGLWPPIHSTIRSQLRGQSRLWPRFGRPHRVPYYSPAFHPSGNRPLFDTKISICQSMHCNVPGLVQLLVHTVEVESFTVDTAPLSTRLSNASWRKRGHGIADISLTPEKNATGSCIQVSGVDRKSVV